MHARQRDFFEAGETDALDFGDEVGGRHAARATTRRRDDAVRARLRAAGLNAQRERSPTRHAGRQHGAAAALAVAESLSGRRNVDFRSVMTKVESICLKLKSGGKPAFLTREIQDRA